MPLGLDGQFIPTDRSGASLTFSNITCGYAMYENMVFFFGSLTYPTTADSSTAKISPPVAAANHRKAVVPGAVGGPSFTFPINIFCLGDVDPGSAEFINLNNSTALTNAQLSGLTMRFMLVYPAY